MRFGGDRGATRAIAWLLCVALLALLFAMPWAELGRAGRSAPPQGHAITPPVAESSPLHQGGIHALRRPVRRLAFLPELAPQVLIRIQLVAQVAVLLLALLGLVLLFLVPLGWTAPPFRFAPRIPKHIE